MRNKSVLELVERKSAGEFLVPFGEPSADTSDLATHEEHPHRLEHRIVCQGVTDGHDASLGANNLGAGKGRLMRVRDAVELRKD